MKKFIIAFAGSFILVSTAAFAGGGGKKSKGGDNPAEATFQKTFQGASDVKWAEDKETINASFTLSNSRVIAYFNYEGELLGTARSVLFDQLPLAVIREVNDRYGSAPVYDITEYTCAGETFYHMVVETPTKQVKVKVTSLGDISVLGKTKR
jgi:hypothetical protein